MCAAVRPETVGWVCDEVAGGGVSDVVEPDAGKSRRLGVLPEQVGMGLWPDGFAGESRCAMMRSRS